MLRQKYLNGNWIMVTDIVAMNVAQPAIHAPRLLYAFAPLLTECGFYFGACSILTRAVRRRDIRLGCEGEEVAERQNAGQALPRTDGNGCITRVGFVGPCTL